jgi:dinuclear metal center YbgI/SA1388 family protein
VSVSRNTLVEYLDAYLRVEAIPDYPHALNGLQVEGAPDVSRLAVAVDACQATIEGAAAMDADLLLVHHGLFWGGLEPVVGRHAARLGRLLGSATSLYAAHIPLDLHPEVGNNAVLASHLGLASPEPFGAFNGIPVGLVGALAVEREALANTLANLLGATPQVLAHGPERTARVAIITGGAGNMIASARAAGADTFITGEGAHHTFFDAEEWGMNVIYAGHYATETVGVRALAEHLAERFELPWEFIDHPTGL